MTYAIDAGGWTLRTSIARREQGARTMKAILAFVGLCAVTIGPLAYDASGTSRCSVSYTTSFNGLYIIKERQCFGKLGIAANPQEIARKPLFETF